MNVPFVDLLAQYESLKPEIDGAIEDVIAASSFIGGPRVRQFENDFAEAACGSHVIAVANGTDAIYIALRALDIGPGDEVITVANSWISTSETVTQTGATVVFVDIDEYYNIDTTKIEAKITPATKAIIPVHLYGQPANMPEIVRIAQANDLLVIEDCAQAHLARHNEIPIGTFGDVATFSFYPGKNLGAYGDAGAVMTGDSKLAERIRMFANHGALEKHHHQIEGVNSRMDAIQAAILSVKLPNLSKWTEARRENAAYYNEFLSDIAEVETPMCQVGVDHVYHLYVIQTNSRDRLRAFLSERGIATGIHYPKPLPLLDAYRYLGLTEADFPRAALASKRILSLPMFPELCRNTIQHVCDSIRQFFSEYE